MVPNHFTAPVIKEPQQPQTGSPGRPEEQDPNITNPRFNINRPCIYERQLPGNAYITAHIQRLQHGFYATPAVSDRDFQYVDFLAVSFVFHSPDTMGHRFKAATIRASIHSSYPDNNHDRSSSRPRSRARINHPIFLMHAPHTLTGPLSPETMQWGYSLTGSLGVAQLPVMASLSPAAGLTGRFKRYEMMRIQGSVRSLNGNPASQIVWTLEENNLQRSGLPREFTFAMLIAKPAAESRIQLTLDIEPVLQSWLLGSYPTWWLTLVKRYSPVKPRGKKRLVDFRSSIGQRFTMTEPDLGSRSMRLATSRANTTEELERGFNFARLLGGFEEYADLQGWRTMNPAFGGVVQDDPGLDESDPMPMPMPFPLPTPNPMPMPMPIPYPRVQYPEGVPGTMPIPIRLEPIIRTGTTKRASQRQPQDRSHSPSRSTRAQVHGFKDARYHTPHGHMNMNMSLDDRDFARRSSVRRNRVDMRYTGR